MAQKYTEIDHVYALLGRCVQQMSVEEWKLSSRSKPVVLPIFPGVREVKYTMRILQDTLGVVCTNADEELSTSLDH